MYPLRAHAHAFLQFRNFGKGRFRMLIVKAVSHIEITKQILLIQHTFRTHPQVEHVISIEESNAAFPKWQQSLKD